MIETTLCLPRAGKPMETFIVHPEKGGPHPLVIMYMDMWGMREVLRDLARRVATAGYCCVLPDLYYRGGKLRYAEHDDGRPGKSFTDLTADRQALLQAAMAGLTDAMVIEDTAALLKHLDAGGLVRPGAFGAIGYCMGGRHALCVAGSFADRAKAAACIHGAYLIGNGPDAPLDLAKKSRGEIYFGHAELDRYAPADVAQTVNDALDKARVRHVANVHRGARHGYAIPDRDVFDKHAANRDWEEFFAMLRRQLPG